MPGLWQRFRTVFQGPPLLRAGRRSLTVEHLEERTLLASGPNVTYHGGPLLQNVQLESVFYGQPWTTNTNLEQISDWLTKILVGVGLTQLNNLQPSLRAVARFLGPAFGAPPGGEVFGLALALYFAAAGFLFPAFKGPIASIPGGIFLKGDNTGLIPIQSINVMLNPTVAGQPPVTAPAAPASGS